LLHSAISSVLGLVAGCVLVGAVVGPVLLAFEATDAPITEMLKGSVLGLFISFFAMMFGFLPALLYGAPLYAWLRRRGYANVATAILLGALPGLVMLPFTSEWGGAVLTYGIGVSLCTHLIASRFTLPERWFRAREQVPPRNPAT
jgi:hypothetical protein